MVWRISDGFQLLIPWFDRCPFGMVDQNHTESRGMQQNVQWSTKHTDQKDI